MKSIFDTETFIEIQNRLNNLSEKSERQWGMMTVGQMVYHCQGSINILLEKDDYGLKPNWFVKTFFKKSMYSDKLWRKNLPTMPKFKVVNEKDIKTEKRQLQLLLNEVDTIKNGKVREMHPSFGAMTKEQWGKMHYKHLDHHFRQFGV